MTDRPVAERSILIKNLLDDLGDETIGPNNPIPIQNVSYVLPEHWHGRILLTSPRAFRSTSLC